MLSAVILVGFFGSFGVLLLREIPPDPGTASMLNIMVGTLTAGFAAVVGYWLGSSAGSARKDELLARPTPPGAAAPVVSVTGTGNIEAPRQPMGERSAEEMNRTMGGKQ